MGFERVTGSIEPVSPDYVKQRIYDMRDEADAAYEPADATILKEEDLGTSVAPAMHEHVASDVDGVQVLHGWPQDENSDRLVTLAYDAGTRKVTLTALSGATFDVYVRGEKVTVSSPHVSAAHDATAGGWFYFHDGSAWVWSQTPWDMREVATTCYVYWSTVANSGVAYYELHGANRDPEWHWHEHYSSGTALISGGVLGDYTLATDTDAAIQFSITETVIADEDIHRTLTALPDGGPYTIWRRSGTAGVWTWSTGNTLPFLFGTYPQRNYDAGGGTGWTMADISGTGQGQYLTAYVLAVPSLDADQRFIIVPGQTAYSSLAAAQAETIASLALGDLPWPEACPISQLVFHALLSYTNASNSELVSVARLIGNRASIAGAAAASNHNALSGLQGGTAGEYYHLTSAELAALHPAVTISDTQTVNLSLTGQALSADVLTQMSVTADASGLKLSGDVASPGNSYYYGTNAGGTKGWYVLPTSSGGVTDGDKGDVVVSSSGTVWTLDAAVSGKLVTNGDTHDHSGGDGGQIAYSTLSGLPTLGTAAAAATTDFAAAGHDHTGADGTDKLPQANTHESADTDTATSALHHTLGTGANQAAAGNHTHSQLHDRSHAMTGASDHTAGNWKVFYSNGSGAVTELALGAANTVLQSNGASAAPSFATPASASGLSTTLISGNSGNANTAAAPSETWQILTGNATTNGTTSIVGVMTTSSLAAGTYFYRYDIISQSAATTTAQKFSVNASANVTKHLYHLFFPSAGVTAATGVADQELNATTGAVWAHESTRANNTTLGPHTDVDTQNADVHYVIEGILVLSGTANLVLGHASEVAANSTVRAGTMLRLKRLA